MSETQSNIAGNVGTAGDVTGPLLQSAYNLIGLSCQGGSGQCGTTTSPSGGATFPLNVTSIPRKATYSYVQQWSLSVQRQIGKAMLGQIAYVGTKGTHLAAVRDLNQLQPLSDGVNPFAAGQPITASVCESGASYNYFSAAGLNPTLPSNGTPITSSPGIGPGSPGYNNAFVACTGNPGFVDFFSSTARKLGVTADTLRPYLGFGNIISVENAADSEYHAFQATVRQTSGPPRIPTVIRWMTLQTDLRRTSPTHSTSTRITQARTSINGIC